MRIAVGVVLALAVALPLTAMVVEARTIVIDNHVPNPGGTPDPGCPQGFDPTFRAFPPLPSDRNGDGWVCRFVTP